MREQHQGAPTDVRPTDGTGTAGVAFIDGAYVPAAEARISVFDSGFTMGASVFDTLACWNGWLFKLDAHLDRLYRSAHAIRIDIPYSKASFREIVVETTRRAGLRDAYVQCIVTRGIRGAGPPTTWPPTTIVYAVPYIWAVGGPEAIERGVRVITARTRNLPPEVLDPKIKNFNRLNGYLAKLEAMDVGADDAVLLDLRGCLAEGRGANIFLVRQARLYTPDADVLWGITRETVFEIAAKEGLPADFAHLTPYDLYNADEAFFCTTAGGIVPIVAADGRQVGDGTPGPITRRIAERHWQVHQDPRYAMQVIP
jgi:branched-chain amino acid aminotransferase